MEDRLPVRQELGTLVRRSPYFPPVRLVADEITSTYFVNDLCDTPMATFASIEVQLQDSATPAFEPLTHADVAPRQTAINRSSAHFRISIWPLRSRIRQKLLLLRHEFRPSLFADPSDAQTWYLLGRAYVAGQKYIKAYETYQQAVYRDGRNPTFWCSIGVLCFQINQFRDASSFSKSTDAGPHRRHLSLTLIIRYRAGRARSHTRCAISSRTPRGRSLCGYLVGIAGDFTLSTEGGHGAGSSSRAETREWLWIAGEIGDIIPRHALVAEADAGTRITFPSYCPHAGLTRCFRSSCALERTANRLREFVFVCA